MESTDIRAIFDRIAPVYDQMNDRLSLGQHRIWKQMTVKWSKAKLGDTCLDVCCGSGDLALRLVRSVGATGKVYGADFAVAQLEIAKQRALKQYPHPPITWVEADALNLPFALLLFPWARVVKEIAINVANKKTCFMLRGFTV